MSLAGKGAITIWQDVRPEAREEFFAWHNAEHIPERVGIPGFLRGRRYAALAGAPEFFTLYETATPEVHTSPAYFERLNNPTEQTRRVAPMMINNVRSLCRVAWSRGTAVGGLIATLRFDGPESTDEELLHLLVRDRLPRLLMRPGVTGAHLCLADKGASSVKTEEKKSRPTAALVPGWVVMVEGAAGREGLERATADLLDDRSLSDAGASEVQRGIYALQISVSPVS
jgi:hypothetical protein